MTRIAPVTNPSGKAQELLAIVEKKMGRVPNMMKTLANSPATLEMYLTASGILGGSSISPKDRERIALLSAERNQCTYCSKAHAALGKGAGLTDEEVTAARKAQATDPKAHATLALSSAILEKKGHISSDEFAAAKKGGLSDAEILEVAAITTLNIFTNYVNSVSDPVVDF